MKNGLGRCKTVEDGEGRYIYYSDRGSVIPEHTLERGYTYRDATKASDPQCAEGFADTLSPRSVRMSDSPLRRRSKTVVATCASLSAY